MIQCVLDDSEWERRVQERKARADVSDSFKPTDCHAIRERYQATNYETAEADTLVVDIGDSDWDMVVERVVGFIRGF